jgi:hypothetical protein
MVTIPAHIVVAAPMLPSRRISIPLSCDRLAEGTCANPVSETYLNNSGREFLMIVFDILGHVNCADAMTSFRPHRRQFRYYPD